jgi:hypothetical protein
LKVNRRFGGIYRVDAEDGGDISLLKFGGLSTDYLALYPRRYNSHLYICNIYIYIYIHAHIYISVKSIVEGRVWFMQDIRLLFTGGVNGGDIMLRGLAKAGLRFRRHQITRYGTGGFLETVPFM